MKTTTLLRSILTSALVAVAWTNLLAIPGYPDIAEIVYTNGGRQDSTGYYGYLTGQPGTYAVKVNPGWNYIGAYELNKNTGSYSGAEMDGLYSAAYARALVNLPPLNEDYRLEIAALKIAREMFRQQWVGVNFPDGKNLAWFLNSAGWVGDPNTVVAITTVADDANKLFAVGNHGFPSHVVKNFPQAVNPAILTMGYAQSYRLLDLHGNKIGSGRVLGDFYEVVLFGTEQVTAPSEAIYDGGTVDRYFNQAALPVPINVVGNKGKRLKRNSIVVTKRQLVGRATLKGRLPAGVHFNAGTGAFTGTPHRKGVFRVMITATYRKVAGEGASGRYTSKAILRIRK